MKKFMVVLIVFFTLLAFADNPRVTKLIELLDVVITAPADGDILTFDAIAGKWQNKPTTPSPDGPRIVYKFNVKRGTDPVNFEAFIPSEPGTYRINLSARFREIDSSIPCQSKFAVSTLNDLGSPTFTGPFLDSISLVTLNTEYKYTVGILAVNAGSPVIISFDGCIASSGPLTINVPYDISAIIEKL